MISPFVFITEISMPSILNGEGGFESLPTRARLASRPLPPSPSLVAEFRFCPSTQPDHCDAAETVAALARGCEQPCAYAERCQSGVAMPVAVVASGRRPSCPSVAYCRPDVVFAAAVLRVAPFRDQLEQLGHARELHIGLSQFYFATKAQA